MAVEEGQDGKDSAAHIRRRVQVQLPERRGIQMSNDCHVRTLQRHKAHERAGLARLPDDLDSDLGEQPRESRPHKHHVISYDNSHATSALVPPRQ